MLALKSATPTQLLDEPMAYSPSRRSIDIFDVPSPVILSRGRNFFDIIYGKISNRVMGVSLPCTCFLWHDVWGYKSHG